MGMPQSRAHQLRRDQTEAERVLWRAMRARSLAGAKFRRQHPVGPFVADFLCHESRLIVEIDGGQHALSPSDAPRTRWLEARGFRVIRFWNNQVLSQTEAVLEEIAKNLRR
jgi:very-short-patch-repair endonuclease